MFPECDRDGSVNKDLVTVLSMSATGRKFKNIHTREWDSSKSLSNDDPWFCGLKFKPKW